MHPTRDTHKGPLQTGHQTPDPGPFVHGSVTRPVTHHDAAPVSGPDGDQALTLAKVLTGYRYSYTHESDLQVQIAEALLIAGITAVREVEIGPGNRIDFMVRRTGIEVKVDGSLPQALRQVDRYLKRDEIDCVLVASTKIWAPQYPGELHTLRGKPVRVLRLARSFV